MVLELSDYVAFTRTGGLISRFSVWILGLIQKVLGLFGASFFAMPVSIPILSM